MEDGEIVKIFLFGDYKEVGGVAKVVNDYIEQYRKTNPTKFLMQELYTEEGYTVGIALRSRDRSQQSIASDEEIHDKS